MIGRNIECFYVNEQHRVIAAQTVTEETPQGDITIRFAPSWIPVTVRSISVFMTQAAAERSAAMRTSSPNRALPSLGTFVR